MRLSLKDNQELKKDILKVYFQQPLSVICPGWNELTVWIIHLGGDFIGPNRYVKYELDSDNETILLKEYESDHRTGREAYFDKKFLDFLDKQSGSNAGALIVNQFKFISNK